MNHKNIAFIGAGNMARAIIQGLLAKGYPAAAIRATTSSPASAASAAETLGIDVSADNLAAAQWAEVLVLAVKPQKLGAVCSPLKDQLAGKLVISVAAGIDTDTLAAWLGEGLAIVRSMPNTPSQVGVGASGLYANRHASEAHRRFAGELAAATGSVTWLEDEAQMHALTAVSGSGPAYFFYFFEAMINAAVELGLSPQQARALTLQTASGAAALAAASEVEMGELKRRVMSPGGTTEQAIHHFDQAGLASIVATAMQRAAARSESLARELGATS